MGFTEYLPAHTQDAVNRAIEQTKENTGMVLNFALNYGSRAEMLQAIQKLYEELDHTGDGGNHRRNDGPASHDWFLACCTSRS